MRNFLLILSGFVLTLAVFAGGALFAVQLIAVEPRQEGASGADTAELWTNEAVAVSRDGRFERLPARLSQPSGAEKTQPVAAGETAVDTVSEPMVDTMTTASVQPAEETAGDSAVLAVAHLEWCANRYRSYRPEDNSYTSFSGEQRACVSPFSEGAGADEADVVAEAAIDEADIGYVLVQDARDVEAPSGDYMSPEHVRSCFSRYRSYRPEDNSYQPYGGGPRRQCR